MTPAPLRTRALALSALALCGCTGGEAGPRDARHPSAPPAIAYEPRQTLDPGGFYEILEGMKAWPERATPLEIAAAWKDVSQVRRRTIESELKAKPALDRESVRLRLALASLANYDGKPELALETLNALRNDVERRPELAKDALYTIIFFQGVSALRKGETDNCIACRGESSCIIPIAPAALHVNRAGSELAIKRFGEYLDRFPDDLGARWLLTIAAMTLGESSAKVDPGRLISLEAYLKPEAEMRGFRDIGRLVGVDRFNQAGGAIMDDFNNDGLLDLFVTSFDPTQTPGFYVNAGDGTFRDRSGSAGLSEQPGGLFCVQADYDNDGFTDILICRGAWLPRGMRPSLLKNDGAGGFIDVTESAGLAAPVSSNSACWADYDNDGFLDLFICCEQQSNKLYRNRGNGTFEEVARRSGVDSQGRLMCKGATWIDYDDDGFPDLFVNFLSGMSVLYHNETDGTFRDATAAMGIEGPNMGFSCWTWDFDNDGRLDILATSYDRSLQDLVASLQGRRHARDRCRLYRNIGGKGFEDVARSAGLGGVYAAMGSNFADFDNDGWLDFYLGTGDPSIETLIPNRMFKSLKGERFADVTAASRTGNLQKGHQVACGDWDRDGDIDLFIEMGGVTNGDKYHNILFQNPLKNAKALTLKLVGKTTNRSALGARIKVELSGGSVPTIHRLVSSGSSFGGNPLEQTIGIPSGATVEAIEIAWPRSRTKQVFRNPPSNTMLTITEGEKAYVETLLTPIALPPE